MAVNTNNEQGDVYTNKFIEHTEKGEVLLPLQITKKEAYTKEHKDQKIIHIDLRPIPEADLKQLQDFFFDNAILLPGFDGANIIYYTHLATTESIFNKIRNLVNKHPSLENHFLHLCLIAGYASNSNLGQRKKVHKLPLNKKEWTDFDREWQRGQELEMIKDLFKLLQIISPENDIEVYKLTKAKFEFEHPTNKSDRRTFKFEPPEPQSLIFYILTDFLRKLERNGNTDDTIDTLIDNYFYPIFGKNLPPRKRLSNVHQDFCRQFIQYLDEQTPFSTKTGKSTNELLNIFIKVYELCGYTIDATYENGKREVVRKWYKPSSG